MCVGVNGKYATCFKPRILLENFEFGKPNSPQRLNTKQQSQYKEY